MDLVTNPALAEGYDRTSRKCRYTYSKAVEPFKQFTPVVLGLKKNGPYSKAINSQYVTVSLAIRNAASHSFSYIC